MEINEAMDTSFQPEQQDSAILKDILQILENNGTGTFETLSMTDEQPVASPQSMSSSASSSPTFAGHAEQSQQPNIIEGEPYIRILEQPHPKGLRFRYICEGRSAGSIPGINSTPENKTFPTIEIAGYTGNVKIIVSCVTVDEPYRPHPHNLVGKEGCEYGVCTLRLKGAPMRAVFSNLGIQCVKKKDIRAALEERERINIDPFKTKFTHKDQPSTIDLNVVRLCFQAFIPVGPRKYHKLKPVVSEPIYDKKSINDLVICRLCSCSARVSGGDSIILLCEKLPKDDIKIRFYEEKDNKVIWEDFGEFQPTDIHKQTAITFKTPRYHNTDIVKKTQVFIQLVRFANDPGLSQPTMSQASDPLPFEFYPEPGTRSFPLLQRKLKRRQDMEIFQQILSLDSETTTKYSEITLSDEGDNDDDKDDVEEDEDEDGDGDCDDVNDRDESTSDDSALSQPQSAETLNENVEIKKRFCSNAGIDDDKLNSHRLSMDIQFQVPQFEHPSIDDCTQTSTPMEEILRHSELEAVRQLSTVDKITQWMKSNEFERTDSLTVENGDAISLSKDTLRLTTKSMQAPMNTELIEQDIDLDDQCDLELLTACHGRQWYKGYFEPISEIPLPVENFNCSASAQASIDKDDNFDDSSTFTSLKIAFENPVDIPELYNQSTTEKDAHKINPMAIKPLSPNPTIQVNAALPPQTPPSPPLPLPPRTPSPIPDQMLPPIPPKRKPSQELEIEVVESLSKCPTPDTQRNSITTLQATSPIVAMSPSDQSGTPLFNSKTMSQITVENQSQSTPTTSPLNCKTMSQIPVANNSSPDQSPTKRILPRTPSPKKKQGFFSRLFSRRKSKPNETKSNADSRNPSRDSSVSNFSLSGTNRTSVKSLQPNVKEVEELENIMVKTGKPVARSVSSVSGKRPLNRDRDVIHIPLKGGPCYEPCCNDSILDRKTLSALQLANIPARDGDLQLIAVADREGIRSLCGGKYDISIEPCVNLGGGEHFALYAATGQNVVTTTDSPNQLRRKRLRSGGNPMRIIQELQQIEQMQNSNNNSNNNNNCNTMWNIPPPLTVPVLPEIKNEPYLSPNYYAAYRSPYQMSPSPQPASPLNRNSTTPSPGLIKTSSAESQTQMCNDFNQIQMNFDLNTRGKNQSTKSILQYLDGRNEFAGCSHQMQALGTSPTNPFFNPTSGGSITPLYPNQSNANVSNTSQFHAFTIGDNGGGNNNNNNVPLTIPGMTNGQPAPNIVDNQLSYQYQHQHQQHQQQQPEEATEAAVTLNALLQIDSDNFVNINSEELRLSNLSIST